MHAFVLAYLPSRSHLVTCTSLRTSGVDSCTIHGQTKANNSDQANQPISEAFKGKAFRGSDASLYDQVQSRGAMTSTQTRVNQLLCQIRAAKPLVAAIRERCHPQALSHSRR